jgi:3-deoxy-manno-octulosonate cytidylyltransferase (CMP-KDO synthetase)
MIRRVYEQVSRSTGIDRVVVATDDLRIRDHVVEFGGVAVMTADTHISGTDRIAEAAESFPDAEIIVNVQGDEPMIDPAIVDALVESLHDSRYGCSTPITRIRDSRDLSDTNVVKVALRHDRTPLYFSRSPIPCLRDREPEEWLDIFPFYRHIGIYAYRRDALDRFVAAPPAAIEVCEQLEQLRMLELGIPIYCVETGYEGHAVDTPEDVMRVERLLSAEG